MIQEVVIDIDAPTAGRTDDANKQSCSFFRLVSDTWQQAWKNASISIQTWSMASLMKAEVQAGVRIVSAINLFNALTAHRRATPAPKLDWMLDGYSGKSASRFIGTIKYWATNHPDERAIPDNRLRHLTRHAGGLSGKRQAGAAAVAKLKRGRNVALLLEGKQKVSIESHHTLVVHRLSGFLADHV